jgi:hypothetical protein
MCFEAKTHHYISGDYRGVSLETHFLLDNRMIDLSLKECMHATISCNIHVGHISQLG